MARNDPAITSFNAGELSPYMVGRPDMRRYANGCEHLLNMIPTVTGALRRRPGTQALQDPGGVGLGASRLIPFRASSNDEFVIEVGSGAGVGYCHFWHAGTRLRINYVGTSWTPYSGSSPATLLTPWITFADNNGESYLQWTQSNDVMWLVHPQHPPVKISRIGTYEFTWDYWGDGYNVPTPFKDVDPLNTTTVQASAAVGVGITLTASTAIFDADTLNRYFYIEQPTADVVKPWEAGKVVVLGDIRRSDGRNYVALNGATTGGIKPTHSTGAKYDGATGVQWEFSDEGFGIAAITVASGLTATATVVRQLPASVVTGTTLRWAKAAWSDAEGWPTSVCFFRERLCFARGQTIWCSVAGDFENFTTTDGGVVTDDLAITMTVAASQNDRIKWLHPMGTMIAGTASGEFSIGELSTADPFSPSNIKAVPFGGFGATATQPVMIGESSIFIQRGGTKVREIVYDFNVDSLKSNDLTVDADHVFRAILDLTANPDGSYTPVYGLGRAYQIAYQRAPDNVIWFTSSLGLVGLTYDRTQEVLAWHRHELGGDSPIAPGIAPIPSSICVVTSPDKRNDDLWMLVQRFDGTDLRTCLEVLGPSEDLSITNRYYYHEWPQTQDACYLDYCSTFTLLAGSTNIPTTNIPVGRTAQALVAGCVTAEATISASGFAVDASSNVRKGRLGFGFTSYVQPMPLLGGSATGASQGKLSRVMGFVARLYKSAGFRFGKTFDAASMDRVEFRKQNAAMDTAVPLYTGDVFVRAASGWDDRPTVYIEQDQPLPLNLLSLFPKLTVEDSR
jgi:hypothetical protein